MSIYIPLLPCVYKITNHTTGKLYIGSTNNIVRRQQKHIRDLIRNVHHNIKLQRSWNKYGVESFSLQIIETSISYNFIKERECFYIELYNTTVNGYNLTIGGEGCIGYCHSQETRDKISSMKCCKEYSLVSPNGERVTIINVKKFCKERNIDNSNMYQMLLGNRKSCCGWTLDGNQYKNPSNSKKYIVTSPTGEVFNVFGLTSFCLENNLTLNNMCRVASGKQSHHKGWKCVSTT